MRRLGAVLIVLAALLVAPATAGAVAPGGFAQLPNPLGCLTNGDSAGTCTSVHDLGGVFEISISPDGKQLYATGSNANTLTIFDRNAATGALTQKAGNKGCFAETATATCQAARFFSDPLGMAMSKDGRRLYVAAFNTNAILTFDRNTATGELTPKTGPAGCISNDNSVQGSGQCRDAKAMNGPYYLAVSEDGRNLYVAAYTGSSVTALSISPTDGSLTQIGDGSGGSGCVENVPTADGCADGRAMSGPFAMSLAEETIYPAAFNDGSVVALARDPATGRLAPVSGATGCVDREGTDSCTTVSDLGSIRGLVGAAGGGGQLYVTVEDTDRVLTFDRLDSGGLVRRDGEAGCITNGAVAGCKTGRALDQPAGIVASQDGDDVYVASQGSGQGLVELNRNRSTGELTPKSSASGCVAVAPAPASCQTVSGMNSMYDVDISPDRRFIYVSASGNANDQQLGVFRRDSSGPVCAAAGATVTQGTLTNLKFPCKDPDGDPVTFTIVNPPTIGGLGLIDEANDQVGYAASQGQCGNTAFTFRATSSGQTSANQTYPISVVGCAAPPPAGPPVGPPVTPTTGLIPSTVTNNWLAFPAGFTKVTNLSVNNLLAGTTVRVTCKTKKKKQQKKGCAYKSKRFTTSGARAKLNLLKPFKKKKMPAGTKLTITVTVPGQIGKRFQYTTRKGKIPKKQLRCISPAGKLSSCA